MSDKMVKDEVNTPLMDTSVSSKDQDVSDNVKNLSALSEKVSNMSVQTPKKTMSKKIKFFKIFCKEINFFG